MSNSQIQPFEWFYTKAIPSLYESIFRDRFRSIFFLKISSQKHKIDAQIWIRNFIFVICFKKIVTLSLSKYSISTWQPQTISMNCLYTRKGT